MPIIATMDYDLLDTDQVATLRVWQPEQALPHAPWHCAFEIDDPVGVRRVVYGESSLQALILAIQTASAYLHSSEAYQAGKLGAYGVFGGNLFIAPPRGR